MPETMMTTKTVCLTHWTDARTPTVKNRFWRMQPIPTDDDQDGVVNAYDFCLIQPLEARLMSVVVKQRPSYSSDADSDGMGITTMLFLLAGAVIVYAVYTNLQRPGPPLPKEPTSFEAHPVRPAMDEEA